MLAVEEGEYEEEACTVSVCEIPAFCRAPGSPCIPACAAMCCAENADSVVGESRSDIPAILARGGESVEEGDKETVALDSSPSSEPPDPTLSLSKMAGATTGEARR